MKVFEYFSIYYLQLRLGYIFILTNYLVAAMVPVLLYRGRQRERYGLPGLLARILLSCGGMELTGVLVYLALGQADAQPYIGGVLLLAAFLLLELPQLSRTRIALAFAYVGMYSVTVGLCLSVGIIWGVEDFRLELLLQITSAVLILCLTLFLRQVARHELESVWQALPIVLLGSGAYVFGCCFQYLPIRPVESLTFHLLLLAALVVIFYVMFSVSAWIQNSRHAYAEEVLRQANGELLLVLKDYMERYGRVRHDMSNHYLLMKHLLEQKEYNKLRAYFEEYAGQLVPPPSAVRCGNPTVAAILNMEFAKAENGGITLETELAVPERMGFADADLCSLLTNLIDNGMDYLKRRPQLEDRRIRVELRLVRRSLAVTVSNPILREDEGQALTLHTWKKKPELHGRGGRIVASLAKRYEGTVCYQVKNGWFEASVLLAEPEEQGGAFHGAAEGCNL